MSNPLPTGGVSLACAACLLSLLAQTAPPPAPQTPRAPAKPPAVVKMEDVNRRLDEYRRLRAAGRPASQVSFEFSETELNQFVEWALQESPRPGIRSLRLKFFPHDYISSYSVLDFDAVERWHPGTIPLVLKPLLSGRRGIWVDIRFRAADHQVTYSVEKAYFGKIPIPALVVEKVIAVVAASQPEHYDTTRPLPLPMDLNTAWTRSQAIGARTGGE